jgi:hypothetical protein
VIIESHCMLAARDWTEISSLFPARSMPFPSVTEVALITIID